MKESFRNVKKFRNGTVVIEGMDTDQVERMRTEKRGVKSKRRVEQEGKYYG